MTSSSLPISILILTHNEAVDLPKCLTSVCWSNDVVVFDSYSTDSTAEIAIASGATFLQRVFDGYASQRNAGLSHKFKYEWTLILDADERVTEELFLALENFLATARSSDSAVRIRRKDFLYGSWLKHSQLSPWFIRLVRPGRVAYRREINEVLEVTSGEVRNIGGYLAHFPFSKGFSHWIDKHNRYSTMEARESVKVAGVSAAVINSDLFSSDFGRRRVAQKVLFYNLPLRPLLKFGLIYFARFGFLDGRAGLTYAILQSIYEYFIVLKQREIYSEGS